MFTRILWVERSNLTKIFFKLASFKNQLVMLNTPLQDAQQHTCPDAFAISLPPGGSGSLDFYWVLGIPGSLQSFLERSPSHLPTGIFGQLWEPQTSPNKNVPLKVTSVGWVFQLTNEGRQFQIVIFNRSLLETAWPSQFGLQKSA